MKKALNQGAESEGVPVAAGWDPPLESLMSPTLTQPERSPATAERPDRSRSAYRTTPPRPGAPRWWRDTAGALTWISMLVVVTLWVSNGGLQGLTGTDSSGSRRSS